MSGARRDDEGAVHIHAMGHVEQRISPLTIEVVVVERDCVAGRIRVRLAELVVHQAAERVVRVHAPVVPNAPVETQGHRVVPGTRLRHAMREHVGELRERAKQLTACDRGRAREVAECGIAKERIRHQIEQRGSEGLVADRSG